MGRRMMPSMRLLLLCCCAALCYEALVNNSDLGVAGGAAATGAGDEISEKSSVQTSAAVSESLERAESRRSRTSKYHRALPVVEPDDSHTKLQLSKEGLEALERIDNPVAVVAVIGPYRSGKSFLLNQLLALSCDEGFGVGHARDTKTKGMWVWGDPVDVDIDGVTTSILYLDTEGFESVGKSSVYDDRIFALAAILSSVLIYNLPETVKEADIAKLSFAVELAEEFYGRVKGRTATFTPARLLWLIQRDFLEGKTVQEMVNQALRPVDNPDGDKDVDQVNAIRSSLALMAHNSTAFGLVQPHLARTKLCELTDADLDPKYVRQREQLKHVVLSLVRPKILSGRRVNGREFVQLLRQTLDALNRGKIPSAGSVVEAFNRKVVDKCLEYYSQQMALVELPAAEEVLDHLHRQAVAGTLKMFEEERFGRKEGNEAAAPLSAEMEETLTKLKRENSFLSAQKCERAYAGCEDTIDSLHSMRLPSMAKFDAGLGRCNQSVKESCVGPSKEAYAERLKKMCVRERGQFMKEYNQRLFNWLVIASLVLVVVGRFVIKWFVVEAMAWMLFAFLEAYTRIFSTEGLYYNPGWRAFVDVWETVVFNPFIDLDFWAVPIAWGLLATFIVCRCWRMRRRTTPQALHSPTGRRTE